MAMSSEVQGLLNKAFADRDALGNINTQLAKDEQVLAAAKAAVATDVTKQAEATTTALTSAHAAIDALTKEIT